MNTYRFKWVAPFGAGLALACNGAPENVRTQVTSERSELTPTARFAVFGDYGVNNSNEAAVASLIAGWNVDFIVTTGDNNYNDGAASTIDANIGQYYHSYIFPYTGSFGAGATANKFWPSLGNHDWVQPGAQPYLDYFALPNNERYYDFVRGDVHLFVVDSDSHEPNGITSTSVQAQWLQQGLASSASPWNVVYFHHSPYSSGSGHGSNATLQWPFKAWGADIVFTGHDHIYERLDVGSFPYIVVGTGGAGLYTFNTPVSGSLVRYSAAHGADLVEADATTLRATFFNVSGTQIDQLTLTNGVVPPTALSRWRASNDATNSQYSFYYSASDTYHRVYIDTDESAATGFSTCSLGANYLLEGGSLYGYTGNGTSWSWSQIKAVTSSIGASSASWTVARADLGETAYPNGTDVCFEAETSGKPRVTSPKYDHVFSNESGPVHAYFAENNAGTIYYQATFDVSYAQKHAFMDTDLNAATGYPVGGIGADYMVENSSVYRYTGVVPAWGFTSLGASNMNPPTSGATGVTTWSFARALVGETLTSGESSRLVFHGRTSAGVEFTTSPVYVHAFTN